MGEIAKILGRKIISSREVVIELNDPSNEGGSQSIHIQTDSGRFELSLDEFRAISAAFITAGHKLKGYKNNS